MIQVAESRIAKILDELERDARSSVADFLSRGFAVGYLQGAVTFAYSLGLIGFDDYERRLAIVRALVSEAREGEQPTPCSEEAQG